MRIPFTPTSGLCRKCGRDAAVFNGEYLCEDCVEHKPHFDRVVSAMRFDGEARELINAYKFRELFTIRADFVDILEAAVRARFKIGEIDCIVPMPSTLYHRFMRGYNQCADLARPLAKRLGKPCRGLLRRVGSPKTQGGLSEEDRRKNIIGTFDKSWFHRSLEGLDTVLLIDDIMTTGSTLSEAALTLKRLGVRRVWGATLARSVRF